MDGFADVKQCHDGDSSEHLSVAWLGMDSMLH